MRNRTPRGPLAARAGVFLVAFTVCHCSTTDPPRVVPAPAVSAPVASAAPSPSAASAAPAAAPQPAPSCVDDAGGPCTLHAWMNANLSAPFRGRDCSALVPVLERVAAFAPPVDAGSAAYTNWASIARDGADAARVEDVEAVKASCRGCHAQYRDRYKRELHDRKI